MGKSSNLGRGITSRRHLIAAVAVVSLAANLPAATQVWKAGTNTTPRNGDWWDGVGSPTFTTALNGANWNTASPGAQWTQGNSASFENIGGSGYTASLNLIGSVRAASIIAAGTTNTITINRSDTTSTLTLTGDAAGTGLANSGGSLTINVPVILGSSQLWGDGGGTTVTGAVSDGGNSYGITKTGNSGITLGGDNTFTGATTVRQGTLTLKDSGTLKLSSGVTVGVTTTLNADYSGVAGNASVNRLDDSRSLILRGAFNLTGNANAAVNETIGSLAVDAGAATITLAPGTGQNLRLSSAGLNRSAGTTLLVRGTALGANSLSSAAANAANVSLAADPTFVGSSDTSGTTMRVLPWAVGDTSTVGSGSRFLTYDSDNGLRPLAATEYQTTLTDGNNTAENFVLDSKTVALTTATSVNSLTLASGTNNINGAATLTVQSGGILSAGTTNIGTTTAGTLAFGANEGIIHVTGGTTTIASRITGSAGLTKGGANTLYLTGSNGYSGVTTINAGTLQLGGTTAGGTSAGDLGSTSGIVLNGGSLTINRSNAITLNQNITGASGSLTLNGTGTTTLGGTNTIGGALTITAGQLNVTGSTNLAGSPTTGILAPGVWGDMKLSGNAIIRAQGTLFKGNGSLLVGTGNNQSAAMYQSSGTVQNGNGDPSFRLGDSSGSYGFYGLSGGNLVVGALAATPKVSLGQTATATGVFYQSAGDVTAFRMDNGSTNGGTMVLGNGNGAYGVYYMTGGKYYNTGGITLGSTGTGRGEMTVSGNSVVMAPVILGNATDSAAVLNLNAGGAMQMAVNNGISTSANAVGTNGVRQANFNGGTFRLTATSGQTILAASANYTAQVYSGGITVDVVNSNGNAIVAQSLLAPAGDGIDDTKDYPIASGGSGYIGAPVVKITGAPGATAVANMVDDKSGNGTFKVASITITGRGINASSPSFTFIGGGTAAGATPVPLKTTANVSGGLTKLGVGTVTLTAANTYTGATLVNAGTLSLSGFGSIATSSGTTLRPAASLNLDYSGVVANATVDRLKDTAALTVGAGLSMTGNANANTTETIGDLTTSASGTTITLTPNAAKNLALSAASLIRDGRSTLLVRGTALGNNAISAQTAGATNFSLAAEPTFTGSIATSGTATRILPWAIGDTSTAGGGTGFLTYDSTKGLRPLAAGEYQTTLTDGSATSDNFVLSTNTTVTQATSVNSLTLASTNSINGAGTITVSSGGILATNNANIGNTTPGGIAFGAVEGVIHVAATRTLNVGSSVTGSAGLTKGGGGTLTFSGSNSYSGTTTVSAGTLALAANGSIDSSSGVNVRFGATFDTSAKSAGYTVNGLAGLGTVKGLVNQAVTVAGVLAPGASAGTLTISAGNLALADGAQYNYEIDGTNGVTSDLTLLTGASSTVTFGGAWRLNLAAIGDVDPRGQTFVLFDSVAPISSVGDWSINYGTTSWREGSVSINPLDNTQVILTGVLIPEPASMAILGLSLLGLAGLRRRSRR